MARHGYSTGLTDAQRVVAHLTFLQRRREGVALLRNSVRISLRGGEGVGLGMTGPVPAA